MSDINAVSNRLREFAAERGWGEFHTPRNLVLALVGEVGELAELFQWRSDAEVLALMRESPRIVEDELADIAIYLIRLSDVLGVDLNAAIGAKILANAERYPAAEVYGSAERASEREAAS